MQPRDSLFYALYRTIHVLISKAQPPKHEFQAKIGTYFPSPFRIQSRPTMSVGRKTLVMQEAYSYVTTTLIPPFLSWGLRFAPVVMMCNLLWHNIVDTNSRPSSSPRVELTSDLVMQITSRRLRGSTRIVERLRTLRLREGARTITIGAPVEWRNKRTLVTLFRPMWSRRCLFPEGNEALQILEAIRSIFRRRTKKVYDFSHGHKYRSCVFFLVSEYTYCFGLKWNRGI